MWTMGKQIEHEQETGVCDFVGGGCRDRVVVKLVVGFMGDGIWDAIWGCSGHLV